MSARRVRCAALLCSAALMSCALAAPAGAQDAVRAGQQADQIIRNQSEQLRQQQERMQENLRRPPSGASDSAPRPERSGTKGRCIPVDDVEVSGTTLVEKDRIASAVAPWKERCLGIDEINSVLQAVTYLYIERGYVASRAFLPEQNLRSGALKIKVVEGQLKDIGLKGKGGTPGQLVTAFPGLIGGPVNLRQVEQGLDQINRLDSMKATIGLEPGKELGETILGVSIDRTKPFSFSAGSDNLGSPSTGIYQSRVGFGFDNVIGLNDAWQFGYQRSMARSPLFFSGTVPNSDLATGSFSLPFGSLTAGVDGSWSQYHSSIQGQVSTLDTSGHSVSVAPYLTWLIDRDQSSKTWVTGRLTWKSTDNFLLGTRIDASSRTLSVASLDLGHSRQILGGVLNASIGYQHGLSIFGAFDDTTAPDGSPKGQFDKVTASLGYSRAEDVGPGSLVFSSLFAGQWSNDPLFASEQMAIGGYGSVRGARDALLSGSTAFYMRNELSFLLPPADQADLASALGRIEPYVALDIGRSIADTEDGSLGGTMTGGTVGIRNRGGRVGFDLSYARILSIASSSEQVRRPSGLVLARLSVSF